jgi:ABC-type transporter Mla subunit MlaD
MTEDDVSYEIIPVTPIRKLEERMEKIESSGSTPQLQNLINQIIELIRNNQKIVNDVIQANNDLRNELSKLPSKMDELIDTINGFLELVEAAGKEEVNVTPQANQPNADAFKPIIDELKKISDQNQKLVESNQVVLDELGKMDRKLKGGMPVSTLLSNYPLKKEIRKVEQL